MARHSPFLPRFINWDAVKEHHDLAMNPRHPHVQGTSQGPDIFFQCVEVTEKRRNEEKNVGKKVTRLALA